MLNSPEWYDEERPIIVSKRFYSSNKNKFLPDENGMIDMTDQNNEFRFDQGFIVEFYGDNDYTNFDYGYFDTRIGKYWHVNQAQSGMEVYLSSLSGYSKKMPDFNLQVFLVIQSIVPPHADIGPAEKERF
jgi:hypothetical protein